MKSALVGLVAAVGVVVIGTSMVGPGASVAHAQTRTAYAERFVDGMAGYAAALKACNRTLDAQDVRGMVERYLTKIFDLDATGIRKQLHRYQTVLRRHGSVSKRCPRDQGAVSLNNAVNAVDSWRAQ